MALKSITSTRRGADSGIWKQIEEYFRLNATTDTDPMTTWEAHKCVTRGILIAKASIVKKRHQTSLNNLLAQVGKLELTHKSSLAAADLQALVNA